MVLDAEYKFYNSIKEKLLKENEGQYVLIKGHKLIGIFDTPEDAYRRGIEEFGNVAFLIQEIVAEDEPDFITAISLAL